MHTEITYINYKTMYDLNTLMFQLTVGDYIELHRKHLGIEIPAMISQDPEPIRGIGNIANYFKCSKSTVAKQIREGKLKGAIVREGRVILFYPEKFQQLKLK